VAREFGNTGSIHHYTNALYMAADVCELENKKVKPIVLYNFLTFEVFAVACKTRQL
jgi:hypothetical protein